MVETKKRIESAETVYELTRGVRLLRMSVTLLSTRRNLKRNRDSGSKSSVVDVPLSKRRSVDLSAITSDLPLSGKVTYEHVC